MIELAGVDPDGRHVPADAGIITATPYANWFVVALEQAGQCGSWIWISAACPSPPSPTLHDGFLSPDGRHFVVSSYDDNVNTVIDLAQARIVRKIPVGCKPFRSGALVRAGGRLLGMGYQHRRGGLPVLRGDRVRHGSFEVVKRIPVAGPTESAAAHPECAWIIVDIVGTGPNANKLQFIGRESLEVEHTLEVAGRLVILHFPGVHRAAIFSTSARAIARSQPGPARWTAGDLRRAHAQTGQVH